MSLKQNDNYIESKQEELIKAIECGDFKRQIEIRQELKDSGLLTAEEVEELNNYN